MSLFYMLSLPACVAHSIVKKVKSIYTANTNVH